MDRYYKAPDLQEALNRLGEYRAIGTVEEVKKEIENSNIAYLRLSFECDKQEKRARIAERALMNVILEGDNPDKATAISRKLAEARAEIGDIDYEKQIL